MKRSGISRPQPAPQSFRNGEIHNWYRIVLGFSDHLVSDLIEEFGLKVGDKVLDPFSGSGTTAVECKKRGIDCWAVDANPSSLFATKVKTTWSIAANELIPAALAAASQYFEIRHAIPQLKSDKTYKYLEVSGMIERGWITESKLLDVVALKQAIGTSVPTGHVRRATKLALMQVLVHKASNVRFGPELYCGKPRRGVNVVREFLAAVEKMDEELSATRNCLHGQTHTLLGDSRSLKRSELKIPRSGLDAIITSPPYPTEHDYTRNSRLELALLEHVTGRDSLRIVKKRMVRSHTKGFYSTDTDSAQVTYQRKIQALVKRIDKKAEKKKYGFARLYGKVTKEYFGGMRRHFHAAFRLLKPGGKCAYVVGDQASYFRVNIATAEILADIARAEGFAVVETRIWRQRWATATQKYMREHVLILRKPKPQN